MKSDEGNAVIEFIVIVVALIVPIAYAIIAFSQFESAAFGVEGAAQMAGRAYVQSSSQSLASFAAVRSAAIAGRNHGLIITASDVDIACSATPCLTPGASVRIAVRATARIGAGPFRRTVTLRAQNNFVVDQFRQEAS